MPHNDNGTGGIARNRTEAQVRENLEKIATGIFLNIDNNMLTACQRAADAAMIKVCGSTENCDDLVVDNGAGTRSFKYEICEYDNFDKTDPNSPKPNWTGVCRESLDGLSKAELKHESDGTNTTKGWAGKLSGLIYWGEISYEEYKEHNTDKQTKFRFTPINTYMNNVAKATLGQNKTGNDLDDETKEIIRDRVYGMEIKALTSAVENAINAIESDQTVQYCMFGREFQGYKKILGSNSKTNPRFPNLTAQMRQIIATSALKNARDNYMEKYDSEMERMAKDQVKAAKIIDEEAAKQTAKSMCIALGNSGTLPASQGPTASNAGKWVLFGLLAAVAVAATILSFGSAGPAAAALVVVGGKTLLTAGAAVAIGAGAAATSVALNAANNPVAGGSEIVDVNGTGDEIGYSEASQWNYKESIKTIPNYETGVCTKIKITQNCTETKKDYCKEWGPEEEDIKYINLLN